MSHASFPDADAAYRAGQQAAAAGRLDEARRHFAAAAETGEHADALVHLSYLGSKEGKYREPLEHALRAFRSQPRDPRTVLHLLNRLRNFNQTWAIRDLVAATPALLDLPDPRALHAVSAQLSYIGDYEGSIRFLGRALQRNPNNAPVLLARGQNYTFLGRFDEARADLEACLKLAPTLGAPWWTLAQLRRQTPDANHVDSLRRHLAAARDPGERAYLAFALHKELDDLGDIDGAWKALMEGCAAKRRTLDYSDERSQAMADELMATEFGAIPAAPRADHGFTPVFIVGMFRSGTTLLEQLLGANPNLTGAGELYDIPSSLRFATDYQCPSFLDAEMIRRARRADFSEVAASYIRGVEWRAGGHSHVTDKLPPNFWSVGYICKAFPDAPILHMTRDPMETCFSNLRELFSGAGQYSYDLGELAAYYRRYEQIMAFWRERFPGRVLDIHYSRLTTDTEAVMREVAAHCGLEFLPQMVDPQASDRAVATASAVQVRSPVISRKVAKWKAYEAQLQPLARALESGAR
jgi:tetratricopeptide (TPR) repeat protein